jgi:demethylmenaquinone methyltransferase/2-methoxy-6-polyprenyl-1,4-benzoquinol methylase
MSRKEFFNEAANTWDQRFYTPELAAFLEKTVPKFGLGRGQKVLDVGTGIGILIPYLLRIIGPSGAVTAIDYAERMVEKCKLKYSHIPNVTIEVQNMEELNFSSESFDAITCFGLFPHLENKEKALYHMNRVLKPRGRLIIAHALSSLEIKVHHSKASSVVAQDILPEKPEMKRLLKNAGFDRIYIKDEPGCYLCLSTKKYGN